MPLTLFTTSNTLVRGYIFETAHNINILQRNTFLHDFVVILNQMFQNYQKILKKCFLVTHIGNWVMNEWLDIICHEILVWRVKESYFICNYNLHSHYNDQILFTIINVCLATDNTNMWWKFELDKLNTSLHVVQRKHFFNTL